MVRAARICLIALAALLRRRRSRARRRSRRRRRPACRQGPVAPDRRLARAGDAEPRPLVRGRPLPRGVGRRVHLGLPARRQPEPAVAAVGHREARAHARVRPRARRDLRRPVRPAASASRTSSRPHGGPFGRRYGGPAGTRPIRTGSTRTSSTRGSTTASARRTRVADIDVRRSQLLVRRVRARRSAVRVRLTRPVAPRAAARAAGPCVRPLIYHDDHLHVRLRP